MENVVVRNFIQDEPEYYVKGHSLVYLSLLYVFSEELLHPPKLDPFFTQKDRNAKHLLEESVEKLSWCAVRYPVVLGYSVILYCTLITLILRLTIAFKTISPKKN